jgi:hypothetical protein
MEPLDDVAVAVSTIDPLLNIMPKARFEGAVEI